MYFETIKLIPTLLRQHGRKTKKTQQQTQKQRDVVYFIVIYNVDINYYSDMILYSHRKCFYIQQLIPNLQCNMIDMC